MISLLVVNYRSSALAADAIRTARAGTSAALQVVVVDNSCDASEAEALRGVADTLIVSPVNRGYAGGINDGRRACDGETIVVSNPDVTFAPETLDRLANAIGEEKAAVAGPAIFWDDAHRWRLPPGDLLTARQKIDEVLASRSRAWRKEWDRRRIRKRIAFWSLDRNTDLRMLSGAVMAIRAQDFDAVGGFDERFALYFEETDFLRRVAERRRRIVYVPGARCRHIFNQSASQAGELAAARYAESEMKYLEKWSGPFAARMLKRIERPLPECVWEPHDGSIRLDGDDLLVEASPLATFATAAGTFVTQGATPASPCGSASVAPASGRPWAEREPAGGRRYTRNSRAPEPASPLEIDVPPEVRSSMRGAPLYVRVVARATAAVLATYRISP